MAGKAIDAYHERYAKIMAMVLAGSTNEQICKALGCERHTITRAKKWHSERVVAVDYDQMLVRYMEECLETLAVQVRHGRDKTWLNKQKADGLAAFHEKIGLITLRLFGAHKRAEAERYERAAIEGRAEETSAPCIEAEVTP